MTKSELAEHIYIPTAIHLINLHGKDTKLQWFEERAKLAIEAAEILVGLAHGARQA
jgi:hypothetical protein